MAGSGKSSGNGFWSSGFAEEGAVSIESLSNNPRRKNRVQEQFKEHNAGLGGRKDEPHSEDEDTMSKHTSLPDYLRPRISKDLLPHDFMRWTAVSGNLSASSQTIPSSHFAEEYQFNYSLNSNSCTGLPVCVSNEALSDYVEMNNEADHNLFYLNQKLGEGNGVRTGAGLVQETRQLHDLCFSDLFQQVKGWEREGGQRNNSLKEMEMQGGVLNVGTIDKDLYQNLVEMIPLMESFMDERGNQQRSFAHHASLVYTPAPSRDGRKKKESPLKVKNKHQRAVKALDGPHWNDQENVLSRVEKENIQEVCEQPHEDWSTNCYTIELRSEIEELKEKLLQKDQLLQAIQTYDNVHDAVTKTNEQLQNKIEELQQALRQKEHLEESAQLKLSEQQHQIEGLSTFLGRLQGDVLEKNDRAFQMEKEMAELRCQVTALRYQLEAVDLDNRNTHGLEFNLDERRTSLSDSPESKLSIQDDNKKNVEKLHELSGIELARRMYLAAVVAARENPGEETLTLAAECRKQLQTFVIQFPMLFKSGGDCLTSQTFGMQLI